MWAFSSSRKALYPGYYEPGIMVKEEDLHWNAGIRLGLKHTEQKTSAEYIVQCATIMRLHQTDMSLI